MNEDKKSIQNPSPPYQTHTQTDFKKPSPKSGSSNRRQVVHPRPRTPKGESVGKPGPLLLIILNIICKSDKEGVCGNLPTQFFFFSKIVRGYKHPTMWICAETLFHTSTRMWNMISSPTTPTMCLEQKYENFQSRNVTFSMPSPSQK